jgi:hypothetical protein
MAATKLETFHPFPRLPIELRLQIWALAIPCDYLEPPPTLLAPLAILKHEKDRGSMHLVRLHRASPILFAVNREARSETARVNDEERYPLELCNGSGDTGGPCIYVNSRKEKGCVQYSCPPRHKVGARIWDNCRIVNVADHIGGYKLFRIVRWDWERNCPA